jgi:hypothetical protein
MAGYGSAIGMGSTLGGLGSKGAGGSQASLRGANAGSLYGPKAKTRMGAMAVHHWVWLLCALELLALVMLRVVVFRPYHAG